MEFQLETDVDKCRELWDEFSPKTSLFDLWEYRFCFQKGYGCKLHFIVGVESGRRVGVLPLWKDKEGFYTFFGGMFPENNTFFIKDKSKIGDFIGQCPEKTWLSYIRQSETEYYPLKETDPRFYLDMSKYENNIETLISSFDKKHRKNLRYDLRQLEKQGYSSRYNHLEDFDRMIELNKKRFEEESDFNEQEMIVGMSELMHTAYGQGKLSMISLVMDGVVEAVGLAVIHGGWYYIVNSGQNIGVENLGKLMVVEHIKSALRNGISKLDFMATDSGWKRSWHLETEAMFEFSNY